jgi:GT2 family glycosyltransferase
MQVSIIIVNYNTFDLTSKCIKSILNYTHDLDYEIILVDNASSECNVDEFSLINRNIIIIKNKTNVGFARANNIGIEKAQGEYVLLLNSDTELIENSILKCYNEFKANQTIDVLTCRLISEDKSTQYNCQSFPSIIKLLIEKLRIHKFFTKQFASKYLQGFYWNYDAFGYPNWIWGTFFMFKKKHVDLLAKKKLNDDFFMYIEDMQWCLDFKKLNLKIAYTPSTKVVHYMGGSNGNKRLYIKKNYNTFLRNNYNFIHRFMLQLIQD